MVRASDWNSEDAGSNPGWTAMSFFIQCHVVARPLVRSNDIPMARIVDPSYEDDSMD